MRTAFIALSVMLQFWQPRLAVSQEIYSREWLRAATGANVEFIDQVTNGCLPRPKAAQHAAEVELLRSDFKVTSKFPSKVLRFGFLGWELKNGSIRSEYCVAAHFLELTTTTLVSEPSGDRKVTELVVYRARGLTNGPKANFQDQLESVAAKLARDFTLEWLKLRQE